MDESQVRDLVTDLLKAQEEKLTTVLHTSISGAVARTKKDFTKELEALQAQETESPAETEIEYKKLSSELNDLREKLANKEAESLRVERESALTEAIGELDGVTSRSALAKLMRNELELVKGESGQWLTNSDVPKTPKEAIQDYLSTEEGKVFVKAPTVKGSGLSETQSQGVNLPSVKPEGIAGKFLSSLKG